RDRRIGRYLTGGVECRARLDIISDDDDVGLAMTRRLDRLLLCPCVVERAKTERFEITLYGPTDGDVLIDDQGMAHGTTSLCKFPRENGARIQAMRSANVRRREKDGPRGPNPG